MGSAPARPRARGRARRRAGRRPSRLTSQRVQGVVALLFALLFAGIAGFSLEFDRALAEPGVRSTRATVTEVHDCTGRCDPFVVVAFTTDAGRAVTADLHEVYWDPPPRSGDVLAVRYNPRDPLTYLRDERLGADPFGQAMLGTFAGLFAVAGVAGLANRLPWWIVGRRR